MGEAPSLSELNIEPEDIGVDLEVPAVGSEDGVMSKDILPPESDGVSEVAKPPLEISQDDTTDSGAEEEKPEVSGSLTTEEAEEQIAHMTPRERTLHAIYGAKAKIISARDAGLITDPAILEQVGRALLYAGSDLVVDSQALTAMERVLSQIGGPHADRIREELKKNQYVREGAMGAGKTYSLEEWQAYLVNLPEDQRVAVQERGVHGFIFPREEVGSVGHPEDTVIQELVDELSARSQRGETLTQEEEQQLKLLQLASGAKGEGGVLLKAQLLQRLGIDTSQDVTLAQRLEAAGAQLDDLLQTAGASGEDIELLSSLSSSDASAFMDKVINLRIDGLDTLIFGKKLTVEQMQVMLRVLPLSQEKRDALSKLPTALPIGLGLLFGLLSLGYAVGKASIKEARK